MRSIPEHFFVILSQRKACAVHFREETAGKQVYFCRPNSNYLLTQSQVRYMTICSNLPIQKAVACTELHSCKGTQTWTDLQIVARGFYCVLRFSMRNRASKPKNRGFTPSPNLALLLTIVRQRCEDRKSRSHKLNTQQTIRCVF